MEHPLAGALASLQRALEGLDSAEMSPASQAEAAEMVRALLSGVAQLDAQVVRAVAAAREQAVWRDGGFRSLREWLKHVGRLSGSEAWGYATVAMTAHLVPAATEAHRRGELGCAQARLIAAVAANPRVADALPEGHKLLVEDAGSFDMEDFTLLARRFVEVADPDGAGGDRAKHGRNARMDHEFAGGWRLTAGCADLDGAELHEIFTRFIEAETLTDWAHAREACGEAAAAADLPRTAAQRRFDALASIFRAAAGSPPEGVDPDPVVCVVVDEQTLVDAVQRTFGSTPPPKRPIATYRTMRCETLDGDPLSSSDALAAALVGQLRRVVYGQGSVVVDLGVAARFFRGNAALATRLSAHTCYWPGCRVRSSRTQIDHLVRFGPRGPTDQHNAGPACGHHHRFRHRHGYQVRRNSHGTWTITSPDGKQLE
jgi:hypothetical protein